MKVYYSTQDISPLPDLCHLNRVNGSLIPDMVTPIYQAFEVINSSESRSILRKAGIKLESIEVKFPSPVRFLKNNSGDYKQFVVLK